MSNPDEKRYKDLATLSMEELEKVIRDRLQGHDAGGPPLDPRGGIPARQWLTDCYRQGDKLLQQRMDEILAKLLNDILTHNPWLKRGRDGLFVLAQSAGDEKTVNKLHELLENHSPYLIKEGLAGSLLKCLIAHGCVETQKYWLDWFAKLGPQSGALIFSALEQHDIEVAMEHLPELAADEGALLWIFILLPQLEVKYSRQQVVSGIHKQWFNLSDGARAVFAKEYGTPVSVR